MKNNLTKKAKHRAINKAFYEFVNKNYPQYEIDNQEGYGKVYLIPKIPTGPNRNELILYHQSEHYIMTYNYANEATKKDAHEMNVFLQQKMIEIL